MGLSLTSREGLDSPTLTGEPSGVALDEGAHSILAEAAALRFPNIRGKSPREQVNALVDYITDTAIARGDLEELRLQTHLVLLDEQAAWRGLPVGANGTEPQREERRRAMEPALADRIMRGKWLVARCTEQLNRLGGSDYDAASRAYTLLTG